MFFENTLNIIFVYIALSFVTGYFRRKDITKQKEIVESIEKIQNNSFQLFGFVLVSLTVLMIQQNVSNLVNSLSTFSLGLLLLIISIIMGEIKVSNFITHVIKRLNYGSLFCLSAGFLYFFVENINTAKIPFIGDIYLSGFLFVGFFIVIDILSITGILKNK